jgi:signal transduction histidine kinase/ligand-binding sensor domain-containing protein/DNA-binding response OmpR family regulator
MLKETFFSLAIIFFFTVPIEAQQEDIRFEHINVQDGLSNSMIFYIYQDINGFIWFNDPSLQRYDGHILKFYEGGIYEIQVGELLKDNWGQEPDSLIYFDPFRDSVVVNLPKRLMFLMGQQTHSFIKFGCINCFLQDSDKKIWFGSSTDGLFIYQRATKSFQNLRHQEENEQSLSSNKVSTVLKDKQGRIWIGTWDGGLNLREKDAIFRHFRFEANNPNSLLSDTITCLIEDKQGLIWIGTPNGLNCFNPMTNKMSRILLPAPIGHRIRKIFVSSAGKLYLGTQRFDIERGGSQSIVVFDPATNEVQAHFEDLLIYWNNRIFSAVEDHLGRIWLGSTSKGLYIYDPTTRKLTPQYHNPRNPKSVSSNAIRQLYRDKDNRIWVGSFNGINIYDPNAKVFNHVESDKEGKNYFNSEQKMRVIEDRQGNIWTVTRGAGLVKRNPKTGDIKVYLHKNDLLNVAEDNKGNIWMTDYNKGLFVLNPSSDKITLLTYMYNMAGLVKDAKGSMWASGTEGLLVYSSPDTKPTFISWRSFKDASGKALLNMSDTPFPTNMVEGCDGNIWIIGNFPLIRLNPIDRSVRQFYWDPNDPNGILLGNHFHFTIDRDCHLWLSSRNGGGIACLPVDQQNVEKPKFRRWHTGNSTIPHDNVESITTLTNGRIGFSSPKGVTLFDPVAHTFKTYGREAGMKTQPIALVQCRDSTIYIGGMNGIGYFNPEKLIENMHNPPLFLTDIQLNGLSLPLKGSSGDTLPFKSPLEQSISFTKSIKLEYWQNEIILRFSVLNYTAHESSKFKYQLIGYDKDWKETDASQPFAGYTNLSSGTYTFRVLASNNDGVWNTEGANLEIVIRPPWWLTWWAYLFYTVSMSGSAFLFYRFQLNRRLEKAEAERLKELDAVKTRLYTNITHEFRTPLTVILGMAQQVLDKPKEHLQDGLKMIIRNGQNLLNLVNQMLDLNKLESGKLSLHYQQGDVVNFLNYIVESFHSLAEAKGVHIHFLSDFETLTMDYDETRLQQVVANLLSNAIKFTPKDGNIYLSLNKQDKSLLLKVKDTGIGITEGALPFIFDRFYQADDTHTRHGEGTGIGLALTHELVKIMEGSITVKSQVDKGTEFIITLPIRHISQMKMINNDKPKTESRTIEVLTMPNEEPFILDDQNHTTEKPLVLISDDNADVRAYIASCLATDYRLDIAKDGQECENIAFDTTPDLIVLDVMMPFKDGFEVCKTLKSDERTSHIPIIMLTAKADIDSKLQGLEQGADAYLMKPFHKEELLLRIKNLLELRQHLQHHYLSKVITTKAAQIPPPGAGGTEGGNSHPEQMTIPKDKSSVNGLDHAFVIKTQTIIEAHLSDGDFDVEKLSRALALSPSQVHRKLTALTGISPNHFVRYVRLIKAKELLQHSGYSIAAIAYDCGFSDPAYFSRVFKQEFGMTPQVWREENPV